MTNQSVIDAIEIMSKQLDDPRLAESGFDEGFNMYLNSKAAFNVLGENLSKEFHESKDFASLFRLWSYIGHLQFVRTAHLGHNGEAIEATYLAEQWKPVPDEMRQAYTYMKHILHDLDVAFNKGGVGETYGVTYTLHGEFAPHIELVFDGE